MRARLIALGAAAALALAGCTEEPAPAALPPVTVVEPPAASAGGACVLWDYAFIEERTGVRFTVAAGDRVDDTATCVVQTESGAAPSLVLTVVDRTSADAALFTAELMPKKATRVVPRKMGVTTVMSSWWPEVSQGSLVISTSPGPSVSGG